MSDLETFLSTNTVLWHSSIVLIKKYGKEELNRLYVDKKIEVREGLNCKVVKYIKIKTNIQNE